MDGSPQPAHVRRHAHDVLSTTLPRVQTFRWVLKGGGCRPALHASVPCSTTDAVLHSTSIMPYLSTPAHAAAHAVAVGGTCGWLDVLHTRCMQQLLYPRWWAVVEMGTDDATAALVVALVR